MISMSTFLILIGFFLFAVGIAYRVLSNREKQNDQERKEYYEKLWRQKYENSDND